MSAAGNAESYAGQVKNQASVEDKIDKLAQAVQELARAVKQMNTKVQSLS